jgi:hypothetical protein
MMKSKTKITINSWQRTTIIRRRELNIIWCERCAAKTAMFAPEEFARLSDLTPRTVYQRIENGDFHFVEIDGGALLVCEFQNLQNK